MTTVFVHRYSGILSAYGLALADVVQEAQEPCTRVYEGESTPITGYPADRILHGNIFFDLWGLATPIRPTSMGCTRVG